ncbi:MAG: VCBS repeat-containing protein [Nitrospirae bacterium]|nr:VCBS repeat-containing protein [Nitrospirota bacterium]
MIDTHTTGDDPRDVVFGDFDGDGNQDVAVAPYKGDSSNNEVVSLLLSDGIGGLGARIAVPPTNPGLVLLGSISLAVGRLNGDAIDDLVVVYNDNDSYAVVLGNATPASMTASAPVALAAGGFPRAAVIASLNPATDPLADLAIANSRTDQVVIHAGNGDGTFAAAPLATLDLGANTSPWDLAAGDLNGDTFADLAVVVLQPNGGGTETLHRVRGFLNDGSGAFSPAAGEDGAATVQADADIALADLNGDGRADAVRTLAGTDQVAVFLAGQNGELTSHTTYAVGTGPSGVAIADATGDGHFDIVTANAADATLSILPGDGIGGFGAGETVSIPAAPGAVAAGDLDGTPGADLAAVHPATDALTVVRR